MKKLSLDLDAIDVVSFVADEYEDLRGTVQGREVLTQNYTCLICAGTMAAGKDADCTSGCVCCRFRPAPKPQI